MAFANTWKALNPGCEYKLWNDTEVEALVQETSKDLIWPIWDGLKPVERADAFRYLVIYEKGGYYADVDVSCERPIHEYPVPLDARMVVGYQGGFRMPDSTQQASPLQRVEQFEQWFFASAPKNPVLLRTLEIIRQKFNWRVHNPCELTGPATFSDAIHEYLNQSDMGAIADEVSFRKIEAEQSQLVANFSYPPENMYGKDWKIWIFAAGRVSSEKMAKADPLFSLYSFKTEKIVQHHYAGTWWRDPKTQHEAKAKIR